MAKLKRFLVCSGLGIICLFWMGCEDIPERKQPVGRTHIAFHDAARLNWAQDASRPLMTTVWYPAASGSKEVQWKLGVFNAGMNAPDAPMVSTPEEMPLIVMSHGTGGAAMQLSWLAEQLASNGYIVAAVNHHGNTGAEERYLPQGFFLWWERAEDIRVLIDKLLIDSDFGARIDTSRIGVAGFSLGGYTSLLLAGARTDRMKWEQFCETNPESEGCILPPEAPFSIEEVDQLIAEDEQTRTSLEKSGASYHESRIKAAYVMAPSLGFSLDPQSLKEIDMPVHIVVGDQDDQALPELTAQPVAAAVPNAELEILKGVGHYSFLAPCDLKGKTVLSELCNEPGDIDRETFHVEIGQDALRFFEQYFGK